jgi:hypothetical protein
VSVNAGNAWLVGVARLLRRSLGVSSSAQVSNIFSIRPIGIKIQLIQAELIGYWPKFQHLKPCDGGGETLGLSLKVPMNDELGDPVSRPTARRE